MKNKKIKTILFLIPSLTVVTTGASLSTISCFNKNQGKTIVSGKVTDASGRAIKNVSVICNGNSVKTNSNGKYSIEFVKATDVICFEKDGYIKEARTNLFVDEQCNVKLHQNTEGSEKQINVNVKDAFGQPLEYCSVTFFPGAESQKPLMTDISGNIEGIPILVPQAEATDYLIPYTINHKGVDYNTKLLKLNAATNYSLVADAYQYDIKAFVANDNENNNIIMHAYRQENNGSSNLQINLLSNFDEAFANKKSANQYQYKLSFCVGKNTSSPKIDIATAENYFDIEFNSSEVLSCHGKALGQGAKISDLELIYDQNVNKNLLTINIPESFYNFTSANNEVIGIHLASIDENGNEEAKGKFEPYTHVAADTKSTNQLCYVRLGSVNEFYQASDNALPSDVFADISWDIDANINWKVARYGEQTSFEVGPKFNFGYQVKFAIRSTQQECKGLFILTKYQQDQMSDFLMDSYMPHFFIDTNTYTGQNGYPSTAGFDVSHQNEKIFHYAPFSGYWMKKFDIGGVDAPFENEKQYPDFMSNGVQLYSKDDLMVTYIPFASLNITDITKLSLTCNLQFHYTGGEWYPWIGNNPTGYSEIPHFEDLASYIRFGFDDSDLIIKENPNEY